MSRKKISLIILGVVFALITVAGLIYVYGIQSNTVREKDKKLKQLKATYANASILYTQLSEMEKKVYEVDSMLFSGNYTIPRNLVESDFFAFIDNYSRDYSLYTYTNTEFESEGAEFGFNFYTYKVSGTGAFDNVYKLIYSIENSKELKKVQKADISSTSIVDNRGIPRYLTKFELIVKVYYSSSDQYAAAKFVENNLYTADLYDAFYPLVRSEIKPNINDLPDVQEASLLSLVPQGAFITDNGGNTFLMKKGDPVYLGYLSDIDYENELVTFILNKGGIIEYLTMELGKKNIK